MRIPCRFFIMSPKPPNTSEKVSFTSDLEKIPTWKSSPRALDAQQEHNDVKQQTKVVPPRVCQPGKTCKWDVQRGAWSSLNTQDMHNRETHLLRPTDALNHNKQINFADDNLMGAILVQKKRLFKFWRQLSSVKHLKAKLNLEKLYLNLEGGYEKRIKSWFVWSSFASETWKLENKNKENLR